MIQIITENSESFKYKIKITGKTPEVNRILTWSKIVLLLILKVKENLK